MILKGHGKKGFNPTNKNPQSARLVRVLIRASLRKKSYSKYSISTMKPRETGKSDRLTCTNKASSEAY